MSHVLATSNRVTDGAPSPGQVVMVLRVNVPTEEYFARLARKRMAAGVLFRDLDDRVLVVEPSYKPSWEIPGGAVEAEESPWAAATRSGQTTAGRPDRGSVRRGPAGRDRPVRARHPGRLTNGA